MVTLMSPIRINLHSTTRSEVVKYSLVIKAKTKDQARIAARKRGITLGIVDKHPKYDEVIATAKVKFVSTLHRWFNEDNDLLPPYEYGALLYFSQVKTTSRGSNSTHAKVRSGKDSVR